MADTKIEIPGGADAPVVNIPGSDTEGLQESASDLSVKLAASQVQIAQLEAVVANLNDQLQSVQTVATPLVQVEGPRLIGEDWSNKTAAQARDAGCKVRVLCSDGYYVPGA